MGLEPFIGEISMFGGNFAPRGWEFCNGQLLNISSNTALFSILGTTYGGDGRSNFGLPDLRGRSPIHSGGGTSGSSGPGLSTVRLGDKGGTENTTLNTTNLPSHNHTATGSIPVNANSGDNDEVNPANGVLSNTGDDLYASASSGASMPVNVTVSQTGGNVAFNNRDPFLAINFIIATQGVFPSRS